MPARVPYGCWGAGTQSGPDRVGVMGGTGYATPQPASEWFVSVPQQLHRAQGPPRDSVVWEPINPKTPWQRRARGGSAMRGAQAF